MPLKKGKSKKAFKKNLEEEVSEGKSHKQALAIAFHAAGMSKKKGKK